MLSVSRALPVLLVLAALLWQLLIGVSRVTPALLAERARADAACFRGASTWNRVLHASMRVSITRG